MIHHDCRIPNSSPDERVSPSILSSGAFSPEFPYLVPLCSFLRMFPGINLRPLGSCSAPPASALSLRRDLTNARLHLEPCNLFVVLLEPAFMKNLTSLF